MTRRPPRPTRTDTLFPYTTLFRSPVHEIGADLPAEAGDGIVQDRVERLGPDRHAPVDAGRIALQPSGRRRLQDGLGHVPVLSPRVVARPRPRSEEHTSELQSLMRISYAVFCLKKKI